MIRVITPFAGPSRIQKKRRLFYPAVEIFQDGPGLEIIGNGEEKVLDIAPAEHGNIHIDMPVFPAG
jgi:hypothetical protein